MLMLMCHDVAVESDGITLLFFVTLMGLEKFAVSPVENVIDPPSVTYVCPPLLKYSTWKVSSYM